MKRSFIYLAVVLMVASVSFAAGQGGDRGVVTVTVTGEVIDQPCYDKGGSKGEAHKACALSCAKRGNQMAILEDGKNTVYSITGDYSANKNEKLDTPVESSWAELREAQTMTLSLPKTGMAVIVDIGHPTDIHPKNKQDVGKRLSLWAQSQVYGKELPEYSSPLYDALKVEDNKARVTFKHVGGGLVAKGDKLTGFSVAGEDKVFVWADAKIDGSSVVVSSDKVAKPAAVRYAWADYPDCNLYSKEGLPASPFRTDDWPRK